MLVDNGQNPSEKSCGFQYLYAAFAMSLNNFSFFITQRAVLEKNLFVYRNLSDIVKQPRRPDAFRLSGR